MVTVNKEYMEARLVLKGVVGSQAYGTARPDSDVDKLAVYVEDTDVIFSLDGHSAVKGSYSYNDPDITYHELGKFISLAAKGNPNIQEFLWLEDYEIISSLGKRIIDNRHLFASKENISERCTGMAYHLLKRAASHLYRGREKKALKESSNAFRVVYQGREFLETGELKVRLDSKGIDYVNEQAKTFVEGMPFLTKLTMEKVISSYIENKMKNVILYGLDELIEKSPLPDKVDMDKINSLLIDLRWRDWEERCL